MGGRLSGVNSKDWKLASRILMKRFYLWIRVRRSSQEMRAAPCTPPPSGDKTVTFSVLQNLVSLPAFLATIQTQVF